MFEYNCIVTIDKKVAGDEIPVTRFTMMMERKMDVYNKVVDWVTTNLGWDALEYIVFKYEEVEVNTDVFQGV